MQINHENKKILSYYSHSNLNNNNDFNIILESIWKKLFWNMFSF